METQGLPAVPFKCLGLRWAASSRGFQHGAVYARRDGQLLMWVSRRRLHPARTWSCP